MKNGWKDKKEKREGRGERGREREREKGEEWNGMEGTESGRYSARQSPSYKGADGQYQPSTLLTYMHAQAVAQQCERRANETPPLLPCTSSVFR